MATTVWLAPGAESISEFARQHSGLWLNGTCVETGALDCAIGQDPAMSVPPANLGDYLQQMVNEWRANNPNIGPNGASSYVDATTWLRSKGFTVEENTMAANPLGWWAEMQHGIGTQHCVYIVGVTNAQALPGDEAGVHNHGLAAVGIDSDGNIICADPDNWRTQVNMPGNPVGWFTTYTRQDFVNASISSLTKVYPMALSITNPAVAQYFSQEPDGSWLCKVTGKHIRMGMLKFFVNVPAAGSLNGFTCLSLPLTDEFYPEPQGTSAQAFQRGFAVYDPPRKFDTPPGATGDVYIARIDDERINGIIAGNSQLQEELTQAKAAIAAFEAQLQTIQQDTSALQKAEATSAQ